MSRLTGRIVMGSQIRAARSLLDWSRAKLARAAGLHPNAIAYWEQATVIPIGRHEPHACRNIKEALCCAGVEFVGHAKPGVRLARSPNYASRPPSRARPRHGVKLILSDWAALTGHKTFTAAPSKSRAPCGAKTRAGAPCQRPAMANGRCRNHGGLSSGPKTAEGRERIAERQRERWAEWRLRDVAAALSSDT